MTASVRLGSPDRAARGQVFLRCAWNPRRTNSFCLGTLPGGSADLLCGFSAVHLWGTGERGFLRKVCGNSAENLRKFAKKCVLLRQERVRKFCGKFAEISRKFATEQITRRISDRGDRENVYVTLCAICLCAIFSVFLKHAFREVTSGFCKGTVPGAPPRRSPGPLRMPVCL